MPIQDALAALARSFINNEREKRGIAGTERVAQEAATSDLVQRAKLAQAAQTLGFGQSDHDLDTRYKESLIRQNEAHANYYETPKRVPPTKQVERTVDLGNRVEYVYTDGSREVKPKGAVPGSGGAGKNEGDYAANPFIVKDQYGNDRLAVRVKGGKLEYVNDIGGDPVRPGPTADMRNVDYQGQAVEPAFELVRGSLANLKKAMDDSMAPAVAGMIPSTNVNFAKSHFQEQARALLGAIVARQAGEGSRMSDEDRTAYSQASAIVNNLLLLPGGVEEAEKRMAEVEGLLKTVTQRRRNPPMFGPSADPTAPLGGPPGSAKPGATPGKVSPNVQRILDLMRARNGGR